MLHTIALFLVATTINLVFSQSLCVKNTPLTSSEWWDGKYNKTSTYYLRDTPGGFLYIYKFDESDSCPYNLTTCWCFSTSSPATYSKSCYVVGDGTSTPDKVTQWYKYNNGYYVDPNEYKNATIYGNFTVETLTKKHCVKPTKTLSSCFKITDKDSLYHGKYHVQKNRIWWYQYQYKNTDRYVGLFIWKYFLFISTKNDKCSSSLLDTLNVNYCWCLSEYAADDEDGYCEYEAPVDNQDIPPTKVQWYNDYGEVDVSMKFESCADNSSSSAGVVVGVVIACLIFLAIIGGIIACVMQQRRRQKQSALSSADSMKVDSNQLTTVTQQQIYPQGQIHQQFIQPQQQLVQPQQQYIQPQPQYVQLQQQPQYIAQPVVVTTNAFNSSTQNVQPVVNQNLVHSN